MICVMNSDYNVSCNPKTDSLIRIRRAITEEEAELNGGVVGHCGLHDRPIEMPAPAYSGDAITLSCEDALWLADTIKDIVGRAQKQIAAP